MKKIINSILHRFKEGSLSRRTETTARTVEYKAWKEIKTLLVFWVAAPGQHEWLKEIPKTIKHVKIEKLCFIPTGTEMLETDDAVTLRNEDLGFGGKILNERLSKLLDKKYDLLLDMTMTSNALINYVLMNTHASYTVGMKKEEGIEADIILNGVEQPLEFIDKLADVLSGIKVY